MASSALGRYGTEVMSEPREPRTHSGTPKLPPKREVALALLKTNSVFVHLDPRHSGVAVPPWFKKQLRLVLQIGLNMAVPIKDLDVGQDALSCTLSFSRRPHYCYIPWKAVFALVNEEGRGMVWPDDVPPELIADAQRQHEVAHRRATLRAVGSKPPPEDSGTNRGRSKSVAGAEAKPEHAPQASGSEEPESPSVARATKGGGESKRPSLTALPPGDSNATSPEGDRTKETEGGEPGAEPPSKESSRNRHGRSLPPYLRVVK